MENLGTWGRHVPLGSRPGEVAWLGRWAALSLGLHGLMLAGIVSLHIQAPAPREPSLRVKLETEVREAPPPVPPRPAPKRTPPRATASISPQARIPVVASPAVTARAPEPEPSGVAQASSPEDAAATPVVTKPPIGNAMGQGSPPPSGPPGESRREAGPLRPEPSAPVSETAPAPAPPKPETQPQGFVLLPGGAEGGTARGGAGAGATDHGTGGGGGGREQGGHGSGGKGIDGAGSGGGKDGGTGVASGRGGGGAGGRGGVGDLFGSIRRQIEQAKIYPETARQAGVEGTVELRFQIGRDGNAEGLEIVRSSGHPELDESAVQTIRRAAPYPAVSGRIRIPLSYRLDR